MASSKKAKYRSLINSLSGIAGSIDSASESIDNIQPKLDEGIKINDSQIETAVFSGAKSELEEAKSAIYRAIRSCRSSMNRSEEEE